MRRAAPAPHLAATVPAGRDPFPERNPTMAQTYRRPRRRNEPQWLRILALFPHIGFALGALCLFLAVLSGLGYRWDWWHFRTGFVLLRWAAYFGAAAAVISLVGGVLAWPGRGRPGFGFAVLGLVAGLIAFGVPANQLRIVYSVPFIHDITTDTENPPAFVALVEARKDSENGVDYGGPEVAAQQKAGYPDIVPAQFAQPRSTVFEQALAVAQAMGWQIAASVPEEGRIEATETTFWYGFKDDVVVRIQDDPAGGTRVDVRSVSRVGKSDVGVNARRIRSYLAKLSARMAARG
jgi:uncharacterized protein (DUF1499 family)